MVNSNNVALSFEIGGIAQAVRGIDDVASAMSRLSSTSGGALAPFHNPFEGVFTGLSALPGAAGKAAAALRVFTGAMDSVANFSNGLARQQLDFRLTQQTLGSTLPGSTAASALGNAFGVDIADLAHSVRMNAFSGPGAVNAASRLHYPFVPDQFPMDEGKTLLNLIRQLQIEMQVNPAQARLDARNLDTRLLHFLDVAPKDLERLIQIEEKRAALDGTAAAQDASRRALQMQTGKDVLHDLFFGKPGEKPRGMGDFAKDIWGATKDVFRHPFESEADTAKRLRGAHGSTLQKQDEALKKHTQALEDNTEQLSRLNGMHGGGPRMRAAIPGAYQGRGDALEAALRAEQAKFGAFGVGT